MCEDEDFEVYLDEGFHGNSYAQCLFLYMPYVINISCESRLCIWCFDFFVIKWYFDDTLGPFSTNGNGEFEWKIWTGNLVGKGVCLVMWKRYLGEVYWIWFLI